MTGLLFPRPGCIPAPVPATLSPTPGQTVGPFFAFGLLQEGGNVITPPWAPKAIALRGVVEDGAGAPVPDAIVEIWQPNPQGGVIQERGSLRRTGETITGFGRAGTSDEGTFLFWTQSPGALPGRAPWFAAIIFARGLLHKLHTRIYLPDDEGALERDPLLRSLTPEERRTLVAERTPEGNLFHTLCLQGPRETVFLEFTERGAVP